jgi:hypothetical protein
MSDEHLISIDEQFERKAAQRRELARLPIEEKLRRLVRPQKRAYAIGLAAGRQPKKPWTIKTGKGP